MSSTIFLKGQKIFRWKSEKKLKYRNFLKQNCSTESSRHLERIFNNFARKFSQTFWKIVDPNHKASGKVFSLKENFHCMQCASSNAKCTFGNPAERSIDKVRRHFSQSPKIKKRIILSWKNCHQLFPRRS